MVQGSGQLPVRCPCCLQLLDAEQGAPGWEDRMKYIVNVDDACEELIAAARALLIADGAL
jgi:hypothetical protein